MRSHETAVNCVTVNYVSDYNLGKIYRFVTITILDIIHRYFSNLKYDVSKTGFSLRPQVERIQLGPIDRDSICLQTGRWIMS
jgi:hypothetical protein